MTATEIEAVLMMPDSGVPRSEGIHVSSVIRAIAAESGILAKEYVESLDLVDASQQDWWNNLNMKSRLVISIGMAWDQFYLPSLGNVVAHPGEMQLDGVYLTPDGESVSFVHTSTWKGQTVCIHEAKATYKSTKTVGDLSTQWLWLAQTKAYCKAAGTRFAYIHVLFLCGGYTYPIQPQLKVWLVEYSQEEIEDNWEMITDYIKFRMAADREDAGLEGGV